MNIIEVLDFWEKHPEKLVSPFHEVEQFIIKQAGLNPFRLSLEDRKFFAEKTKNAFTSLNGAMEFDDEGHFTHFVDRVPNQLIDFRQLKNQHLALQMKLSWICKQKQDQIDSLDPTFRRRTNTVSSRKNVFVWDDLEPLPKEIVIVDTETTGFYIGRGITEIAALKVNTDDWSIVETFQMLTKPKRSIPKNIQRLTGITPDMVADAPSNDIAVRQFLEFAGDTTIFAYNSIFDHQTISYFSDSTLGPFFDVLPIVRARIPDMPSYKLSTVTDLLGIEHSNAHRALADCMATKAILQRCYQ